MNQLNTIRKQSIIRNLKFSYDKRNDLLYVYKENTSVYSNVMVGDFHVEFSRKNDLVGIEILNASDILKEYDFSRKTLENIEDVSLKVVSRNNSLLIFLIIRSMNQEKSAAITMNNLEAPLMKAITSA